MRVAGVVGVVSVVGTRENEDIFLDEVWLGFKWGCKNNKRNVYFN